MHYGKFQDGSYGFSEEPQDGFVEVPDDQYQALMSAQHPGGQRIVPNKDGYPEAVDQAPLPIEVQQAEFAGERDTRLAYAALRIAPLQDAVDLGVSTSAEQAALLSWKGYRVALGRLQFTTSPVNWPTLPQ